MAKRMLIDATHPEETRVVVLNGNRLEEFDFETSTKKQIKGNIYLAKVTRVEPSLQAAFVEYGGNRHGFLAFSEIHPDYYQIPVSDREAMIAAATEQEEQYSRSHARQAAEQPDDPATIPESGDYGTAESIPADVQPAPQSLATSEGLDAQVAYAPADGEETGVAEPAFETGHAAATPDETHGDETGSESSDGFIDLPEDSSVEMVGGDDIEEAQQRGRIHYRNYKIQEVIKRRQILLVQVTKEERGNKGAALTTYLSLAGRYCVLMPNAGRGGGVSRKITSLADRRRLKELMEELNVPDGMGVIVRTAGSERPKPEIHRDYEYLLRLWDDIRDLTLRSSAPAFIYEEGNLIKRAIRDLYNRDIEEIQVEGEEGYRTAKEFMRMLMPSHVSRVRPYRDPVVPLLHRYQVDAQIDQIHNPTVQLKSGGYIVINPTEALVAIDVNSGRSTKERNIEETATKTNLEAADEIARQLRLRDLAGLIVIDFIDMEESRNRGAVERRLKEAMKNDRARIQLGRISPFGLLEMSRQRLRSSLIEASTQVCPHCNGTGTIRSTESTALVVLRALEEEGIRQRTAEITLHVPTSIALYILNQKRDALVHIEQRYNFRVLIQQDDALVPPAFRLDRIRAFTPAELTALSEKPQTALVYEEEEEDAPFVDETVDLTADEDDDGPEVEASGAGAPSAAVAPGADNDEKRGRRRRRRRRRGATGSPQGGPSQDGESDNELYAGEGEALEGAEGEAETEGETESGEDERVEYGEAQDGAAPALDANADARRRRGRRGGRRRGRERGERDERPAAPTTGIEVEVSHEYDDYPAAIDFARDGREHLFGYDDDEPARAAPAPVATAPSEPALTEVAPQTEAAAEPVIEAEPGTPVEAAPEAEAVPEIESAPVVEAVAEPVAEAVAPTEVTAEVEATGEERPKRRRVRRKPAAEPTGEVAEVEAAKPAAEEPAAPKPRSRRGRRGTPAADEAAPLAEISIAQAPEVAASEPTVQAEPVAEAEAIAEISVAEAPEISESAPIIHAEPVEASEAAPAEAVAEPAAAVTGAETDPAEPEAALTPEPASAEADAAPAPTPVDDGPQAPRRTGWWRRLVD